MDFSKTFKCDKDAEKNGVWFEYHNGSKLLIARSGGSNAAYVSRTQAVTKPYKRQIDMGTLPAKKIREINAKIYSETILKGWQGVQEDGVDLPFSVEKAYELMVKYVDFLDDVWSFASDREAYLEIDAYEPEQVKKN